MVLAWLVEVSGAVLVQIRQFTSLRYEQDAASETKPVSPKLGFVIFKRCFDIVISSVLLVPLVLAAVALLIINRFYNPGPLFYVQDRMGQGCVPFRAYKFRSMLCAENIRRGAFDDLEVSRITPLGRLLRKCRVDELPQVWNVLIGNMSLIGPRPDFIDHACIYVDTVPGYRARHSVKPGITGLAQTEVGYVDGREGLDRKVAADLAYIRDRSIALDLWITWRTIVTVFTGKGS
ncbi:sugar transferase [Loktanella sp. TSTF-M6]|uniref:Sugar transferase n=1 Tax=Loktanella gaetbuli TaxID=2881335 RepID=A0ABS8BPP9_9RHOB|nr:sugar transferase [Loktanella gaetbuli]MCB5197695.1 sugar transferase [Loktanella gaetbuli]